MAAGLGFKNFSSGEVLTAADVNAYLNSQTVMVFADTAARTAAITSPQEGMFSYLKDTNVTQYYTGSAWANLDTTGMVNPMTTTGDTIYSSSGSTPARLAIGSTGNVLTVAGGVPTWAAPAGGGQVWSLVTSGSTTSGTGLSFTSLSGYDTYALQWISILQSGGANLFADINGTASSYYRSGWRTTTEQGVNNSSSMIAGVNLSSSAVSTLWFQISGCKSSTDFKNFRSQYLNGGGPTNAVTDGIAEITAAVTSLNFTTGVGTFTQGTYRLYGAN